MGDPCSNQTRLSRSTILRWVGLYLQEGRKLEALYPQERNDKGRSRVLDQETGAALAQLRRQLPDLAVVDLVKQMHDRHLVTDGIALSLSTAYRFLHRHNLMANQPVTVDRRKFEAELPNAEISVQMKAKALQACEPPLSVSAASPRKPVWRDDQALLNWLENL